MASTDPMRGTAGDTARWALPAILLLGLALRLAWVALIAVEPVSDPAAYDIFATNIAEHGVYGFTPDQPGAYWAVGPSALYAFGYLIAGTGSPVAVVTINLISSLAAIWLLHDLGRRWFGGRVGVVAALLFAIWPLAIQFTTVLASELHFIALTLAGLAAWDRGALTRRGLAWIALAGLAFGAATYMRPIALLIPAALAVAALLRGPGLVWRPAAMAVLATALIFALVAPWSARNERVFDEPVFMSTNFWANFWMGNNPETTGGYMPLPPEVGGMSEIERANHLEELSKAYLREAPLAFIGRTAVKAVRLHDRETIGVVWNEAELLALTGATGVTAAKLVSTGYWYAMLAGALFGIWVLARQDLGWRVVLSPPVWLWLYFTGVHAVIVIGDRYHMPAIPLIALLAAVAICKLLRWDEGGAVR